MQVRGKGQGWKHALQIVLCYCAVTVAWGENAFVVNDPQSAWHFGTIGAPWAWRIQRGYEPYDQVVAIVSTGVRYTHEDLKVYRGTNIPSGTDEYSSINSLGTEVSGLASALHHNGKGVPSLFWSGKLYHARVTNNTNGSAVTADVVSGIEWAVDAGARVILVTYAIGCDTTILSAAKNAWNRGALVVMPLGDAGTTIDCGSVSGNDGNMIRVVATGLIGSIDASANSGPAAWLAAPGVAVRTTGTASDTSYVTVTGSAYAAAVVASAASANAAPLFRSRC